MFLIPFHVRKYHLLTETDENDKNVCNTNRKKTTPGPKSKFFDEETAALAIETTLEKDRLTCVRNSVKHANREELTRPFGFFLGVNSDRRTNVSACKLILCKVCAGIVTAFPVKDKKRSRYVEKLNIFYSYIVNTVKRCNVSREHTSVI